MCTITQKNKHLSDFFWKAKQFFRKIRVCREILLRGKYRRKKLGRKVFFANSKSFLLILNTFVSNTDDINSQRGNALSGELKHFSTQAQACF